MVFSSINTSNITATLELVAMNAHVISAQVLFLILLQKLIVVVNDISIIYNAAGCGNKVLEDNEEWFSYATLLV